jgi:hypothetical protein
MTEWDLIRRDLLLEYGGDTVQVEKAPQFVRAEDVKQYGITKFKILTEPKLNEGNFGIELTCEAFAIRPDGEKDRIKWRINDRTRANLIDKFGKETAEWVGKELSVSTDNKAIIGVVQ